MLMINTNHHGTKSERIGCSEEVFTLLVYLVEAEPSQANDLGVTGTVTQSLLLNECVI